MEKEVTKEMLEKSVREFCESVKVDPTIDPICPNEAFFQEKHQLMVNFLKKNGLPKHLEDKINLSSL
ncbi:MAG TPA: hypothetical protein VHM26_04690 [Chitinophagaceae bacterium]|jgi:hypothetical protein|nr:hypothetical protein [Chitinophagaceae bacterium]